MTVDEDLRPPRELAFALTLPVSFPETEALVRRLLAVEGFGVLTEIDVQATLSRKLGVEIEPYSILGACNPYLASRAIAANPAVGLLLPCNVVLRRVPTGTRVEVADPTAMLALIDDPELQAVAEEAREKLARVVETLESDSSQTSPPADAG